MHYNKSKGKDMGYNKDKVKPVTVYVPLDIIPAVKNYGKKRFRTDSLSKAVTTILEDWYEAQKEELPSHRTGGGTLRRDA